MEEHIEEISCIKDGRTGICRDIKDKKARAEIQEVATKLDEVIDTVNNMPGGDSSGSTGGASQEELNKLSERITVLENEEPEVTQEELNELSDRVTVLEGNNSDSTGGVNQEELNELSERVSALEAKPEGVSKETYDELVNKYNVKLGKSSQAVNNSVAIGGEAKCVATTNAIAIGTQAVAKGTSSIQLGGGTNTINKSLQIYSDNIYNQNTHTLTVQNIELNGEDLATKLIKTTTTEIFTGTTVAELALRLDAINTKLIDIIVGPTNFLYPITIPGKEIVFGDTITSTASDIKFYTTHFIEYTNETSYNRKFMSDGYALSFRQAYETGVGYTAYLVLEIHKYDMSGDSPKLQLAKADLDLSQLSITLKYFD